MVPMAVQGGVAADPSRDLADGKRPAGHDGRRGPLRAAPFAAELAAKAAESQHAGGPQAIGSGAMGLKKARAGRVDADAAPTGTDSHALPFPTALAERGADDPDPAWVREAATLPSAETDGVKHGLTRQRPGRDDAECEIRSAASASAVPAAFDAFFGLRAAMGNAPAASPAAAPAGATADASVGMSSVSDAPEVPKGSDGSSEQAGVARQATSTQTPTGPAWSAASVGAPAPAAGIAPDRPGAAMRADETRRDSALRFADPAPNAWRPAADVADVAPAAAQRASHGGETASNPTPLPALRVEFDGRAVDIGAERLASVGTINPRKPQPEVVTRGGPAVSSDMADTSSAMRPDAARPIRAGDASASGRDGSAGSDPGRRDRAHAEPIVAAVTRTETHLAPSLSAASPAAQVVAALADGIRPGPAAASAATPSTALATPSSLASPARASRPDAARTLQLALNPVDLGAVTLTLHLSGGTLRLHVAAEKAATAALFGEDGRHLARALGEAGYDLGSLSVVVDAVQNGSAVSSTAGQASGQSASGQALAGQGDTGAGTPRDTGAGGSRSDFGARSESGRPDGGRSGGQGTGGGGDSGRSGQTRKDMADAGDLPRGRAGGVYV